MLRRPEHIPANIAQAPLNFRWTSELAMRLDNPESVPRISDGVLHINYKGNAALGLACLEWVAWASTFELARGGDLDFHFNGVEAVTKKGDPSGPRQEVFIRIQDLHYFFKKSKPRMRSESSKSIGLAMHVLPADCGFEAWLKKAMEVLAVVAPGTATYDRKVKVVDHSHEPAIPRNWFSSLAPVVDASEWNAFMRELDATNPYLVAPE